MNNASVISYPIMAHGYPAGYAHPHGDGWVYVDTIGIPHKVKSLVKARAKALTTPLVKVSRHQLYEIMERVACDLDVRVEFHSEEHRTEIKFKIGKEGYGIKGFLCDYCPPNMPPDYLKEGKKSTTFIYYNDRLVETKL